MKDTTTPFESRSGLFDTSTLPVPADRLVFTEQEIRTHPSDRFRRVLEEEAVWVWPESK
jgi:hypothetical protein